MFRPLSPLFDNEAFKRFILPPETYYAHRVSAAIDAIERGYPDEIAATTGASCKPVFIFAAGWGSGSTLLQRLVLSSQEVLVWGEPFDIAAPIQRLASTLHAVSDSWPPEKHFNPERDLSVLAESWVANFSPTMAYYKQAHRAFLEAWLANHTGENDAARWGLKEVRLTIDHARYLKWLFPDAKFLFLYRDVYKGYLGLRRRIWMNVWPDYQVRPAVRFAHHWKHLLSGYIEHHQEVGGLLIRFEDLIAGKVSLTELADYLEVKQLDASLLEQKVGARGSTSSVPLLLVERMMLDGVAGDLREQLGYA